MMYLLYNAFRDWFDDHGLGFLRVFTAVTFQGVLSILVSFIIVLLFGPSVIAWLRRNKLGDLAQFDQAEIDKIMADKRGTPTMGGLLIIASITITTLLLADLKNFYVQIGLICLLGLGLIGASDDWLKLTAGRRSGSRVGLTSAEKFAGQLGLAIILSFFTYRHGAYVPEAHTIHVPFFKNIILLLGPITFVLLSSFMMTGFSNAVNLTDGLDGLAAGCMAIVGFSFMVLAIVVGIKELAGYLQMPYIQTTGQMSVLAGSIVGACLGFLWFNCNPAKVFMGDTGSLALGGLIGYISVVIGQELLLIVIGGIFVAETLSVMLQVSYFKYTRKRFGEGRRIFLMAPLHHHFQRKGWTET
ncbi:MAG TPA: phospho-N-acetylmuramoyl-pentapeptide-transferase, partial [Tepidisphaeraceae bacterium]|nr:phospho-N-acetylmuramoyl-pentapeptide-transferase [Tepidisphaeraceae bacterium]